MSISFVISNIYAEKIKKLPVATTTLPLISTCILKNKIESLLQCCNYSNTRQAKLENADC